MSGYGRVDVAVVGGGIVGLGAALAAVDRGLDVAVFERGERASGASIRNFGHVCLTPQTGRARRYALAAREVWLRLAQDAGLWVRESGTLVVARHADELAVLEQFERLHVDGGLGHAAEVELLDAAQAKQRIPAAAGSVVGGAHLPYDLQVDPRQAVSALTAYLAGRGVQFHTRTNVGTVSSGRLETSRGTVSAGLVVVAAGHDIDQLLPDLAERHEVRRCGLDMLRVGADLAHPLDAPLLTGWSLLRYSGFAMTPAADALRERLHEEHPQLAALDINLMYTQLRDGTVIVGDTHYRGIGIDPFQSESAADALLAETVALFGIPRPRVIERWQGVYATAPDEFLIDAGIDGVLVLTVTTGIGMTTGLGVASLELADHLDNRSTPTKGAS